MALISFHYQNRQVSWDGTFTHWKTSGWETWKARPSQSSSAVIVGIWVWITIHKAWPVFLLLTRALAPLPRNSSSPESFCSLGTWGFSSSTWYQAKVCSLGYFYMGPLFPQMFSIPWCFLFTMHQEAHTSDTMKSGIRDVLKLLK